MAPRSTRASSARRVSTSRAPSRDRWLPLILHGGLRLVSVVVLPFVVLVRGSVLFYDLGVPTWLALALAAGLTLGILVLYGAWVSRRLSGKPKFGFVVKWVALPMVVGYCGYAVLFMSRANAKSDAVRSAYLATHPLLRVALTTVILADRDIVVTDLSRAPDDYRRMGLTVRGASLHYPQQDGWVHAVDLRTAGRGFVANSLIWVYFRAMGFDTLRHIGTADHLHVSLPLH